MRRVLIIILIIVIGYLLIDNLVPWTCETVNPPLAAESNPGAFIYSSFSTQRGPSGRRRHFGGYAIIIHEKCTRWSSVVYDVTVGEGMFALETWMDESDLTILGPAE